MSTEPSDSVPAVVPETVPETVPAPAPEDSVKPPVFPDFTNKSELIKFVMKTVAEVETDLKLSDEEKAQKVILLVRQAVQSSPLSDSQKSELLIWCNMALPYLIEAIGIVKSEIVKFEKDMITKLQTCCPSIFSLFKSA